MENTAWEAGCLQEVCSLAGRESERRSSQGKLFTEKLGPEPDSPQSVRTYQLIGRLGKG